MGKVYILCGLVEMTLQSFVLEILVFLVKCDRHSDDKVMVSMRRFTHSMKFHYRVGEELD